MKSKFLLLILCLLFSINIFAKHIVGGIITYDFVDNGKYNFTMKIYRDCKSGGAVLDGDSNDKDSGSGAQQFAVISVYRETAGNYTFVQNINVLLKSKSNVDPPKYPCMGTPPDACVEEGVYNFEYTIPGFPSSSTYHFVYQRCCRNNTIKNIVNPQDVGATYTVAITPEAMLAKNSSPEFKSFPPTVLCSGLPFSFDHSAKDKNNNKLVYSFCSPLEGGGSKLNGSDCKSARPSPACPPPFLNVTYDGNFDSQKPLGGTANLKIDPKTGIMTGDPKITGQFVVGICVEEFDNNGKLLSKIFRDFQFNIEKCDVLVAAGITSTDTSIVQKKYTVRACGFDEITFKNGSQQEKYINSYLWDFDIKGQKVTSTEKNPTIKFPGLGIYTGYMVANPGQKPCSDTAKIEVQVYPGIDAKYNFAYDTCIAGPVEFTDLSTSGTGQISKWTWYYGDGNVGKTQSPKYEYKIPGNFKVVLNVEDKNKCVDTFSKTIRYFPVPPLLIIKPDTVAGCNPLTMRINNLSYPIDKSYKIEWDLGDGTKSSEINPLHTYQKAGIFSAYLKVTSPIGCKTERGFPNLVEVKESPIADFTFTPTTLSNLQKTAFFTDKSIGASKWAWSFGGNEGTSASKNPTYTFRDTGVKIIRLIVTHSSGCRDTLVKVTDIEPVIKYFLPNAFTPNFDNENEEFKAAGYFDGITEYNMIITNRWGERVFESKSPSEGWNGRVKNTGEPVPEGVYVYYVPFLDPRKKTVTQKGTVTLLR